MKKLILQPHEWVKTQDMNGKVAEVTLEELEDRIKEQGWLDDPIFVMHFNQIHGRYPIFNGNNRATIAEKEGRPLNALLIQNTFDYWRAQRSEETGWGGHHLEPEWVYDTPFHYAIDIARHFLVHNYYRARKAVLKAALEQLS
jgi:hypothetical protein